MSERVEECKHPWRDGTCPKCGECHYITVRREAFINLQAALAERDARIAAEERKLHEACRVSRENSRRALETERQLAEAREETVKACQAVVRSLLVYGDARDQRPTYDRGWSDALLKADEALARLSAQLADAERHIEEMRGNWQEQTNSLYAQLTAATQREGELREAQYEVQRRVLKLFRGLYHALVGVALHGVDDDEGEPTPLQAFCDDGWLCEHAECVAARDAMTAIDHETQGAVRSRAALLPPPPGRDR